jgi:hypothetical protein
LRETHTGDACVPLASWWAYRCEILEKGVSVSDLDSAIRFKKMIPDIEKMLLATVAQKFDISRTTVSRMLKIYREKQAEMPTENMNDNRIPIPLTA